MQAQQTQQHRLWGVLLASVFLSLWFSVEIAQAAPKQDQCLKTVFTTLKSQNPDQDIKDFNADLDKAKKAIQAAINKKILDEKIDAMFEQSVQEIICHCAKTLDLLAAIKTSLEQKTRLTEIVFKLRNLFQRIAKSDAKADDFKDWLAKLFFLAPNGFLKLKDRWGHYIWNLVRLELILDNTGAKREGIFVVQPSWTDVDLVLLGKEVVGGYRDGIRDLWPCGKGKSCYYQIQDGLFFIQTSAVTNANAVLYTQQGGQQVAGGPGTLQHYTEIALKHIGANADGWRTAYTNVNSYCITSINPLRFCQALPSLPGLEMVVGIAFWGINPQNADQVKKEITGLDLPAGQQLNAAQKAVQAALNTETKGLVVGWLTALVQQQAQVQYSCAAVKRMNKVWSSCNPQAAIKANDPYQYFSPVDAERFTCNAFGQVAFRKWCKAQEK